MTGLTKQVYKRNLVAINKHPEDSLKSRLTQRGDIEESAKYIEILNRAKDPEDFHKKIIKNINDLGLSDYTFTQLQSIEDVVGAPLTTVPPEQLGIYKIEGFFEHDIIAQYSCSNIQPIFQSDIEKYVNGAPFATEANVQNKELFRMLQSFGYNEHYNIPIEVRPGYAPIIFAVTIRNAQVSTVQRRVLLCRPAIKALGEAIYCVANRKFPNHFIYKKNQTDFLISPKPIQVLQALANGCRTAGQVADQLNISARTVNEYLEKAKNDLGVNSKYQAIAVAVKLGLITV